jgi:rSAM/selenodomain-associated transferase 1
MVQALGENLRPVVIAPLRRAVIIFSRWPHFGQGKRRLAASAGEGRAYRFQRQRLLALSSRRAGQVAGDRRWRLLWALDGPGAGAQSLPGRVFPQRRGDLGQRMQAALQQGQALVGLGVPILLVGSDIPALAAGPLGVAFALLQRADLVYGPAEDGGFWLVGWSGRRRLPRLFDGIEWSRGDTLDRCMDRLQTLGRYRVALADRLADVDDAADLG